MIEGEIARRGDKSLIQRIRRARFPLTKTLDQLQWNWPKKINRPQIQNLFRLNFVETKSKATGTLKRTLQRYLKPQLLVVDELGY